MKKRITFQEAQEKQIQGELFTFEGNRISDFHQMMGLGYTGIVYSENEKPYIAIWTTKGHHFLSKHDLMVEYNAPDENEWHLIYKHPTTDALETPETFGYPSEEHAMNAWKRKMEEGNGKFIVGISKVKFNKQ